MPRSRTRHRSRLTGRGSPTSVRATRIRSWWPPPTSVLPTSGRCCAGWRVSRSDLIRPGQTGSYRIRGPCRARRPWHPHAGGDRPVRRCGVPCDAVTVDVPAELKELSATLASIEAVLDLGALRREAAALEQRAGSPGLSHDPD